jgi:hypothetical protein
MSAWPSAASYSHAAQELCSAFESTLNHWDEAARYPAVFSLVSVFTVPGNR